jgi:signal recognition particle subunit SRP19
MSHPRVEEISDSDSDPDVIDISTIVPAGNQSRNPSLIDPSQMPTTARAQTRAPKFDANAAKRWVCLYPVYFDISRTRQQGRRVGRELAVENPLARTIADAVAQIGLRVYFDPGKTHPKDWANSGRVKVELRDEAGDLMRSNVKNSTFMMLILRVDRC